MQSGFLGACDCGTRGEAGRLDSFGCGMESVVLWLLDILASPFQHALSRQALARNGEGALVDLVAPRRRRLHQRSELHVKKKFTTNASTPPPCDSDDAPRTCCTMKTDFQVRIARYCSGTSLTMRQFSNLLGTVYSRGNLVFTPDGTYLLSPVGNRVSVFDLVKYVSQTDDQGTSS